MKEIDVGRGRTTKVSDEDYKALSRFKWYWYTNKGRSYVMRPSDGPKGTTALPMHRAILGVTDGRMHVDHINGDGLDNQRENLRVATPSQNSMNTRKRRLDGISRFKGVTYDRKCRGTKNWIAKIGDGGKHHIGRFYSELAAAVAYNASAYVRYGSYARLNDLLNPGSSR